MNTRQTKQGFTRQKHHWHPSEIIILIVGCLFLLCVATQYLAGVNGIEVKTGYAKQKDIHELTPNELLGIVKSIPVQ